MIDLPNDVSILINFTNCAGSGVSVCGLSDLLRHARTDSDSSLVAV